MLEKMKRPAPSNEVQVKIKAFDIPIIGNGWTAYFVIRVKVRSKLSCEETIQNSGANDLTIIRLLA